MVDNDTLCSIRNMVEYLEHDEEKHYSECDEEERKNHIYNDVLKVKEWLDGESDLPAKICPNCKKKTLEIHGEGITSENRHYPLENCTNCGYSPTDFMRETHGWLIDVLESWDSTFEDEETGLPAIMDKIRKNESLTSDEYDEILFHLWQKFYDD